MAEKALVAEQISKGLVRSRIKAVRGKPVANGDRFGRVSKMTADVSPMDDGDIRNRILTVRSVQVLLDRDVAELYGVPTKALNQTVKRNMERFPDRFMFQLTKDELENLRSQIVTSSLDDGKSCGNLRSQFVTSSWGGMRYCPYAFTEHGIMMLASMLKSDTAVQVSVRIVDAFVAMRRALMSMAPLLSRIETAERRQIMDQAKNDANQVRNEERFKLILDAMQDRKFPPQKIFFDGQFYDAFVWLKKYIRMARKELIVIDPYFAASVLPQIAQKRDGVSVVIVLCKRGRRLLPDVDVQMFNAQYKNSLLIKESERFHDRYFIIDRKTLVHIGASLNYFGKKCFACSSFDPVDIPEMLAKLQM